MTRMEYNIISLWVYTRYIKISRIGYRGVSKLKTYGIAAVRKSRSKTSLSRLKNINLVFSLFSFSFYFSSYFSFFYF